MFEPQHEENERTSYAAICEMTAQGRVHWVSRACQSILKLTDIPVSSSDVKQVDEGCTWGWQANGDHGDYFYYWFYCVEKGKLWNRLKRGERWNKETKEQTNKPEEGWCF